MLVLVGFVFMRPGLEGGLSWVIVLLGIVAALQNTARELCLGLPMHSAEQT